MLCLYRGEIIARRNDAAIKNDEIVFAGIEDDGLATGADEVTGDRDDEANRELTEQAKIHELG